MNFFENSEKVLEQFQTRQGGFLTVEKDGKFNTMTISWGFIGVLWGKPHFVTVVRPQRYTREFIDRSDNFTVSVPFAKMEKELTICGTKSGRDVDKGGIVKFLPSHVVKSPVVGGCDIYYECVIKYAEDMKEDKMPIEILKAMYKGDLHRFYFGEIVECYGGEK